MSANPAVQQHPASVDAYIRHGWSLVPIPYGTKGPSSKGWNLRENTLKSQTELPVSYGIGLAHAYSGTMALDVDEWDHACAELAAAGIDLTALYDAPDAVIIDSGRAGHGKLLYAMPFGLALPSKKLIAAGADGKNFNYLDFRCSTANGLTVQDVLPPSIHPMTGQPYRWAGRGHWTRLPVIPTNLLDYWQRLIATDRERIAESGTTINASWSEIREALEHIPPDVSREEWINVGMALHWAGNQTGQVREALYLWNEWSAGSPTKYKGEKDVLTQWNSFRPDKATIVKIGTLFHTARGYGWTRPTPDAADFFAAVTPSSPTQVLDGLRPAAPEIDLSLWPASLAQRAREVSGQVGCDPLVPLWAGLAAVCAVADARSRLELMEGFKVPPVLWMMTIGEPADKKSPGSRPMLSPLKSIEVEDIPNFKARFLEWEGQEAAYSAAKKAFLEYQATPEALLNPNGAPMVPALPEQPVPVKLTVSDITSQKLVRHAAERPRGLLCYLDEMNSWVRKLTDPRSGEDRSTWVVSYEAEAYSMDRVGAGSIHCDNLAVAMFGNIQPTIFRHSLTSLAGDGLIQRFIPAILHGRHTRLGEPVPECMTSASAWEQTLRLVYALPETTYRLSPEAYDEFRSFQRWYEATKCDERLLQSPDIYMTAFGKIEGTTGRLALLFHLLDNPFSSVINVDTMHRAIQVIRGYVVPALRYALMEIGGTESYDRWVADYIVQHCDDQTLTLSDLKRASRRLLEGSTTWESDDAVLMAMQTLEAVGWVARIDDRSRENQHFAQWAINPALASQFKDHRRAVIDAKQRRMDEIYDANPYARKLVHGFGE